MFFPSSFNTFRSSNPAPKLCFLSFSCRYFNIFCLRSADKSIIISGFISGSGRFDTFAIYTPFAYVEEHLDTNVFISATFDSMLILKEISGKYDSGDSVTTTNVIKNSDGETFELTVTLNLQ